MSFEGTRQDSAEPLQEEATATAQASIYKQQWQRRGKQFFKKKTPKKHPPQKQKTYEVTFKPKTVLKETSGENAGNVSNSVLSGKGPDGRRYV